MRPRPQEPRRGSDSGAGTAGAAAYFEYGLVSAGTRQEADACAAYAATLDEIAGNGECCPVNADGKVDVEQTSFVLEGIRDGLDNATLIWMKEPHSCSATLNA